MPIHDQSVANGSIKNNTKVDSSNSFTIIWSDLTYRHYPTVLKKVVNRVKGNHLTVECKTIFQNCNGSFRSGRLTAIMGPSGSGKSTLLECLAGVRKVDQVDNIKLYGSISNVSLSFIPQQDQLFERLTVRELMTYAARLQYVSRRKTNCYGKMKTEIDQILTQLNIFDCADQVIENLSGGQKGRISIAQELVASPDIIMMDEPTSGLDSSSSYSLVELLVKLASSLSIAIVITIHQPSARLFNLLQDVYMFSYCGQLMFKGKPSQVTSTLNAVGIKFDAYNNPADVLLDVANGEYGTEVIKMLTKKIIHKNASYRRKKEKPLASCLMTNRGTFRNHLVILVSRHCLISRRDRISMLLKYSIAISVALLVGIIYYNIGNNDGCLTEQVRTWLNLGHFERLFEHTSEATNKTRDHVGAFFFLFVYISISAALSPAAALPFYAKAIRKECSNHWYGRPSFAVAFIIADLPFVISSVTLSYAVFFLLSNQPLDRFFSSWFIYVLTAMNTQARGFIFGSLFIDNLLSSILLSPNSSINDTLLSGFLIRIKELPLILQIFSSISFARISMDGVIVAIFGFKRCTIDLTDTIEVTFKRMIGFLDTNFKLARITLQKWTGENESQNLKNSTDSMINVFKAVYKKNLGQSTDSAVMRQFNLTDSMYIECVGKLLALCLITQIFAVIAFTVQGCKKK